MVSTHALPLSNHSTLGGRCRAAPNWRACHDRCDLSQGVGVPPIVATPRRFVAGDHAQQADPNPLRVRLSARYEPVHLHQRRRLGHHCVDARAATGGWNQAPVKFACATRRTFSPRIFRVVAARLCSDHGLSPAAVAACSFLGGSMKKMRKSASTPIARRAGVIQIFCQW